MEPIDASVRERLLLAIRIHRSKYLPECPAGEVPLSSFSPSKKSSVLSGTNSQDKKGLNESRTVVRPTSDFFPASYFVLFVRKYVLSRVSWLDVAEMSRFSIRSAENIAFDLYAEIRDTQRFHCRKSNHPQRHGSDVSLRQTLS